MKTKISRQLSVISRQSMAIIGCGLALAGFSSCNGNKSPNGNSAITREACVDSIHAVEGKLKDLTTPNPVIYNKAINAYTAFATNFPADSMAPMCLFRAAIFAANLNQYQRALSLYDTVSKKYPNFKDGVECLFNRAYIYDDKLKDTAKAHMYYQMVIDKYPHDSLASQARAAISLLGKTTDEIIKEFEEKNKNKSASGTK